MSLLVDQNFTNYLKRNVQGFNAMKPEHQQHLAQLLTTNSTSNRYAHNDDPRGFYIPAEKIDHMFGRNSFNREMNGLSPILLYRSEKYSFERKATYVYRITDDAFKLINEYLSSQNTTSCTLYIRKTNKQLRKVPIRAVQSKDKYGNTAKATFNIKANQAVNMDSLKDLQQELEKEVQSMIREEFISSNKTRSLLTNEQPINARLVKAKQVLSEVRHILLFANNNVVPGELIQLYVEAKSGRLYGDGVHLQNTSKRVRNAALSGLYDYDIENCHFSLLDQMASNAGYECTSIKYYLKHKQQVREKIATDVGISIDEAKTCLLMMLYGSENLKWIHGAIPKEIGKEKASQLDRHSVFNGLKNDVMQARIAITSSARKHRGHYINAMGKGIPTTYKQSKVLAHLLQGMESKILNIVGEMYSDHIVLLQHDGWVTKSPIDRKMTENRIFEETGIKVTLSEDVINQGNNIYRTQHQGS